MQDKDAIQGLKRLGLTTYEARVFLALQKLGRGAASEISDVADVPRSQVYGAAEGLEEHGLVETRQSTPTVYRPVPLAEARRQLLDELAEKGEETFDYLDTVTDTAAGEERSESIWLIRGSDMIASRIVSIVGDAEGRLLYGADEPGMLEDEVIETLLDAAEDGVTVVVASVNPAVLGAVPEPLGTYRVPDERDLDVDTARLVVADNATVLISTQQPEMSTDDTEEVAFWTTGNTFASVLVELAEGWLKDPFR